MKSYDFISRQLVLESAMIKAWSRCPADEEARALNEDGSLATYPLSDPELHANWLRRMLDNQKAQRLVAQNKQVNSKRRKSGRSTIWRSNAPELVFSTQEQVVNHAELELLQY